MVRFIFIYRNPVCYGRCDNRCDSKVDSGASPDKSVQIPDGFMETTIQLNGTL